MPFTGKIWAWPWAKCFFPWRNLTSPSFENQCWWIPSRRPLISDGANRPSNKRHIEVGEKWHNVLCLQRLPSIHLVISMSHESEDICYSAFITLKLCVLVGFSLEIAMPRISGIRRATHSWVSRILTLHRSSQQASTRWQLLDTMLCCIVWETYRVSLVVSDWITLTQFRLRITSKWDGIDINIT